MEIITDKKEFDKRQLHVLREIILAVRKDLKDTGVPEERVADVTGDIVFSVAAIIDASHVMQVDGRQIFPFLAFAEDKNVTKLLAEPGGSWMHEYVFGMVDDIFDEDEA
jgi:hypothetical protein